MPANSHKVGLEYIKTLTPIVLAITSLVATIVTSCRTGERLQTSEVNSAVLLNGLVETLASRSAESAAVVEGVQNPATTGAVTKPEEAPSEALVAAAKAEDPKAVLGHFAFDKDRLGARDLRSQVTTELNLRSQRILSTIPRRP